MKERNAGLERDVRRYEERLQIEKRVRNSLIIFNVCAHCGEPKIQLLEVVLPYVEYMEAMRVYHDAKDAHKKAHSTLKEVREKQTPLNERRSYVTLPSLI